MRAAMLEVETEPQTESPYSAAETNWGGDSSDATSVEQCAWDTALKGENVEVQHNKLERKRGALANQTR